jgi:SNF2 family DNA or RNA helicase
MNHDGLGTEAADTIFKRPDINLIIVDEASMFRNPATNKYKILAKLCARPDVRVWLLTGTPCPNDPTDAWALAKLVSPERVPKYPGAFKRETMMQITQFKWVPRADAYTRAFNAMQPAVRFKKRDCIDLPPVTTQDRQCGLSAEQRKAFDELKKTMVADARRRQDGEGGQRGRPDREAAPDIVRRDQGRRRRVPAARPQAAARRAAGDDPGASAKVLIVAPFKGIVRSLEKELEQHYSVGVLNGDVPSHIRNAIIREFKSGPDPHILLCHPKVMSHGLNLTEADTLIFYAPIYSNDEYQQVLERFNRAGQVNKMTVVRMAAHPLEWEIYRLLANRQSTQNSILDLYKVVTE